MPNWPVLTGDAVKAGKTPVTLTFPDGSTITMNPGAEAIVDLTGKTPVFRLVKGEAEYSLKTVHSIQVISGNQVVAVTKTVGTVAHASHAGIIIAGAGAGAAGLGVGISRATSGGTSVSPSR